MAHIRKYKLMGNTLYSLHRRPGSGYSVECNEFSLNVQPDYGGGITQEDAEAEAARIYAILNEYDDLKQLTETLRHGSALLTSDITFFKERNEDKAERIRQLESMQSILKDENEALKQLMRKTAEHLYNCGYAEGTTTHKLMEQMFSTLKK